MTFNACEGEVKENDSPPGREHTFGGKHSRPATVDDIPALIDLAYMTYRYSYYVLGFL